MSTAKVFVGSLPPGCKPEELRHLFSNHGVVVECDIMNRCGFVHLETIEMAEAAIAALNGIEFKGQAIVVEPGRPKDRRGGGGGGGSSGAGGGDGGAGNRRPTQGNFNRGGQMTGNNFRGGGNRTSNDASHFGPIRNDGGNFRQQRSAPYTKAQQQNQRYNGPSQQSFKNKFSQYNAGNMSHNDYHAGHIGGSGGGGAGGGGGGGVYQRGAASSNNIGQDRRGFALPAVEHQQARFGNGAMVPSGSNNDNGIYQRNRNSAGMSSGNSQGARGTFNTHRGGGFGGRGGFGSRPAAGSGQHSSSAMTHNNKHGPSNNGHHQHQHRQNPPPNSSYQTDFPPLSGSQGNRNRFNGPRATQNMAGNRRF